MISKLICSVHRNALAGIGRVRQCRVCRRFPRSRNGLAWVSLAFGLSMLTMAIAVGPISGGHFNPAVSCGLWAAGRFPANRLAPYIVAQVRGAVAGAAILFVVASGKAGFDVSAGFAANGYERPGLGNTTSRQALVTEVVMTFGFLVVILGAIHRRAPVEFRALRSGWRSPSSTW